MLSDMVKKKQWTPKILERKIKGKNVVVIGAGSGLEDEQQQSTSRRTRTFVKIAADGAVKFLLENKIKPDIVVTDLDGNPAVLQKAEKAGATMVVHAHGDNTGHAEKAGAEIQKNRCDDAGDLRLKTFTTLAALQTATGACFWQTNLAPKR